MSCQYRICMILEGLLSNNRQDADLTFILFKSLRLRLERKIKHSGFLSLTFSVFAQNIAIFWPVFYLRHNMRFLFHSSFSSMANCWQSSLRAKHKWDFHSEKARLPQDDENMWSSLWKQVKHSSFPECLEHTLCFKEVERMVKVATRRFL